MTKVKSNSSLKHCSDVKKPFRTSGIKKWKWVRGIWKKDGIPLSSVWGWCVCVWGTGKKFDFIKRSQKMMTLVVVWCRDTKMKTLCYLQPLGGHVGTTTTSINSSALCMIVYKRFGSQAFTKMFLRLMEYVKFVFICIYKRKNLFACYLSS